MMLEVLLAGSGPSAEVYDWSLAATMPLCAISSGILYVPRMPEYWVGADKPHFFAKTLCIDDEVEKHVPHFQKRWQAYPSVTFWEVTYDDSDPDFSIGSTAPLVLGGRIHSLLLALQIMPRMGFQELWFIGCDLFQPDDKQIVETMQRWQPMSRHQGVEWVNVSTLSMLETFVPSAPPDLRLQL